ncbi:hypothetical protein [Amycolatopsis sp. FDAARGOS 1241]|uniref:hypothetical protein n=1 Tax=Amycolatopsis sp. FDAARGOS 1241 TaxID=2778070 RepID=UPI001950D001|nr:hypothetical protein [Amycolatopsis sp. FDAARGOS 1241]QRP46148.1 hypothetical protein I6J71_45130 [Amycolatopsis sp. FDAARGOS 1241]
MRLENTTSWRASWGSEQQIDFALYLRDVLALSVADGQVLPPVEPAVPVRVPPAIDRAAVQAQWADWWTDLLAFLRIRGESGVRAPRSRFGRPAPGDGSAIDLAIQHFTPAAARHFAEARRPVVGAVVGAAPGFYRRQIVAGDRLGQLVRETEVHLGRRARPFRLSVIEISVAGRVWLPTAEDQILVSSRFAEDVPALERAMRSVIRELA